MPLLPIILQKLSEVFQAVRRFAAFIQALEEAIKNVPDKENPVGNKPNPPVKQAPTN